MQPAKCENYKDGETTSVDWIRGLEIERWNPPPRSESETGRATRLGGFHVPTFHLFDEVDLAAHSNF